MQETRKRFHDELASLEEQVLQMGERAQVAVEQAVRALTHRDAALAESVIVGDDQLDATYKDIEERTFNLLATQTPVASDLRLVFAILHTSMHLERVGDQGVNIAKMALATMSLPSSPTIVSHLEEMGEVVSSLLHTALVAFARRDAELAAQLESMDEPVDLLNRNMYREVATLAGDLQALEWGIRMNVVSRQLERVGDNAVDIGEQVVFLRTGEFTEFSDASHPELPEGS